MYILFAREQVKDLFVVDFEERAFHEKFLVFALNGILSAEGKPLSAKHAANQKKAREVYLEHNLGCSFFLELRDALEKIDRHLRDYA